MVGSDVCWVQCALNAVYDTDLRIDGKYGPDCAEKVKSFQRDHGLTVDGCVGPQVYTELVKQLHDRGCFEPHVCQGAADANCVTAETCSVCGITLQPALGHSYTAKVTPPTCIAEGYTTHTCVRCGEILVARAEVAPTGHVPDGWSVVAEPSVGVEGKRQQACSTCEAVLNEETIPALPEETEPVTDFETDPVTAPVTDPATDPETVPVTDPVTETPTTPA
jgi:peptidoglycan hydrolase-like protein with peptidoglycan-binding domain